MKKTILYYSAAGHALSYARTFNPDYLIDACRKEEIPGDTDVLGLVFPSVNSGLPFPMKEAIKSLSNRDNSKLGYIFAVVLLDSNKRFNGRIVEKELEDAGLNLSYFNSVNLNDEEKVKEVVKETEEEKILLPSVSLTYRLQKKITERLNRPSLPVGLEVTESCDGCGICSRLCPMDNITIVERKAKLNTGCIHCGECFSFCPKSAIEAKGEKKTLMKTIKLEDLFKRD